MISKIGQMISKAHNTIRKSIARFNPFLYIIYSSINGCLFQSIDSAACCTLQNE